MIWTQPKQIGPKEGQGISFWTKKIYTLPDMVLVMCCPIHVFQNGCSIELKIVQGVPVHPSNEIDHLGAIHTLRKHFLSTATFSRILLLCVLIKLQHEIFLKI